MDDTKKLIEKYKRELMELNRRIAKPAPVPVVDDAPAAEDKPAQNTKPKSAQPAPEAPAENGRKPKIIGYVSEESGEFPAVYDRFLAEIIETDESISPVDIDEHPAESEAPNTEPNTPSRDPDASCKDTEAPSAQPAQSEQSVQPEQSVQSVQSEQSEQSEQIEQPSQSETNDVIDASDVLFTTPKYSDIPSTQQVREEITEQSDPAENLPAKDASGVTDNSNPGLRPSFAPTGNVSAAKAETLADQPISGKDENEQLTGRSFEDESYPQNPAASPDSIMRQGSGAQPVNYPRHEYKTYEEFSEKNTGSGTILFRVYTAQEALPVEGAKCVISKCFGDEVRELYTLITDNSGQTRAESLPAPSKELSQSYSNSIQPFALYDATVSKQDFAVVELKDIPVFDGVQSIQRVAMVPVPPNIKVTEEITEVENAR